MAELVDALGLGSSEVIRGGSSPLSDIGSRYVDSIERRQDLQMPFDSFLSLG